MNIHNAASAGIDWLKSQKPATTKEISRSIQALSAWNENTSGQIEILLSRKNDSFWETDTPLLDTARACSALAGCGLAQPGAIKWILDQQKNGCWNNSEIDTAYALIALSDSGTGNDAGSEWLYRNYGKKWEYVGTTSLIITALVKQNKNRYMDFIKDRAGWLLSRRESGGWTYVATSNLAIQASILAGSGSIEQDIRPSIGWLLEKQDRGNWGDITSTALSLITLKMYMDTVDDTGDRGF